MINSGILDIVIGLVFIYLLYSLLATIIQEIIASNFGFRSKMLERAIFRMLEDEDKFSSKFKSLFYLFKKSGNGGRRNSFSGEFYRHPFIQFLGEDNNSNKPAYLNKECFSKVIVDLLRGNQVKPGDDVKAFIQKALDEKTTNWGHAKINDETLSFLRSIWADSEGDLIRFREYLEAWFEETMDRASGWYKKHTQFVLFFIGLTIAIAFNVDTLKIVDKLEKDPKLREQLVQQAEVFERTHHDLDIQLLRHKQEYNRFLAQHTREELLSNDSLLTKQQEDSLELQNYIVLKARRDTLFQRAETLVKNDISSIRHSLGLEWETYDCTSTRFNCLLKSLMGWVITALALSLGAPFWFDLLNKLMKLRGSVATPTKDDKEKKQG
jgi:hypothetical protein